MGSFPRLLSVHSCSWALYLVWCVYRLHSPALLGAGRSAAAHAITEKPPFRVPHVSCPSGAQCAPGAVMACLECGNGYFLNIGDRCTRCPLLQWAARGGNRPAAAMPCGADVRVCNAVARLCTDDSHPQHCRPRSARRSCRLPACSPPAPQSRQAGAGHNCAGCRYPQRPARHPCASYT